MKEFFQLPVFGIVITLAAYFLAVKIRKRYNYLLLNPVLVAIGLIILFLLMFDIQYTAYNTGGRYLSFFLGPAVVALGVFFYENLQEIKRNLQPFLMAVAAGGVSGIFSVVLLLLLFRVPNIMVTSLAAKSVTTPIAIEITKLTGGIPEITAGIVIAVGIFGNAFGPFLLKFLGIKNKLAIGTALGTAAHGIGTARAFEEGELPGVYSGLAMCVNGILTALVTPYILIWLL